MDLEDKGNTLPFKYEKLLYKIAIDSTVTHPQKLPCLQIAFKILMGNNESVDKTDMYSHS